MTSDNVASGIKNAVRRTLARTGYRISKIDRVPADLDEAFLPLYDRCRSSTLTTAERMFGLYSATRFISSTGIEGDIVECGVWRGGSTMMAALSLLDVGDSVRDIYLYDTFEGMAQPTAVDGAVAASEWRRHQKDDVNEWCYSSLEEVHRNLRATGYPEERVHYVKGRVEETIPMTVPERIALLRLDTDWYESTRHELEHLYPRLVSGGILIIDDYGAWEGARRAVDEYFAALDVPVLMHRLDSTGRLVVKP